MTKAIVKYMMYNIPPNANAGLRGFMNELKNEYEAEFDNFLQNRKEARELKYKLEFLRRSSDKRPSHSVLDRILSSDHLTSEIYKNGTLQ